MSPATAGDNVRPLDAATRNLLLFVQLCFGVFPWLGKTAMGAFEPRAVLVWRLAAGSAVLLLVAGRRHGPRAIPAGKDLAKILVLSLLGISANQLLFLEGLSRSTSINAGLLICVIPVATCGAAVALGQERLTGRRALGIACGVGGVAWLFVGRGADLGGDTTFGDLLMVANAVCYSLYLVLAKPLLRRLPQDVVLGWMFVFGLALVPWLSLDVDWAPEAAGRAHWLALAGVVLFPTVLAYLGNIVVLSRTTASNTALFVLLQPLIAAVLGVTLLGESLEPGLAVTAAGVVSGLWLVSTEGRAARRAEARGTG